ncbi:aspartyl/asparaginyl beta-hydroxylase-like [Gadus chalcogrammus]|uniref:aspartyl/asparaginyl beta-hydroxylase-like n=1 Tax=Gadus chalcogrammus TaxID=1042646 RepID=UPI0024C4CA52|nr:aspartyl/asparaginyl beta-hydroxylase-like [Gadus chalcogrammus]
MVDPVTLADCATPVSMAAPAPAVMVTQEAGKSSLANKNGKKADSGCLGGGLFSWFMVIALLGVWTSVAVVYFDLVDYKGVMGKLSAYDADGDGDFDVEDAKVLLGLKESAVAPATKMEAAAPVEQPAVDAPAPSDQAVIEPDPVEVEEEIQAEAAEEVLAPPPVPEQEAERNLSRKWRPQNRKWRPQPRKWKMSLR